jgi:chloride channel, nucleotide-sensitive, 1A
MARKLYLFSAAASAGLSIPYPTISLHAIQTLPADTPSASAASPPSQGVYMQLTTLSGGDDQVMGDGDGAEDDDDFEPESLALTIVPSALGAPSSAFSQQPAAEDDDHNNDGDEPPQPDQQPQTPAQALFTALSACSNLHPDPIQDGDQADDDDGTGQSRLIQSGLAIPLGGAGGGGDDGLPPPMPGSGGWITAENMHEFVDAEGNFLPDDEMEGEENGEGEAEALGPGAGTVRARDFGEQDGDAKWQRTG